LFFFLARGWGGRPGAPPPLPQIDREDVRRCALKPGSTRTSHIGGDIIQRLTTHQNRDMTAQTAAFTYAKQAFEKVVSLPWRRFLNCLQTYNGLLTALATVAMAVLTYFLAYYAFEQGRITDKQLSVMQGQLNAMQEEFSFACRPHIRLRFTTVEHEGDKFFKAGKVLSGTIDVLNNGQTDLGIIASDVEVYWSKTGLPVCFPKYCAGQMKPSNFVCDHDPVGEQTACTLPPGGDIIASFHGAPMPDFADQIETGTNGWKLYLIGWIHYRGPHDTHTRNFDFAQVFDPKTGRFFPVTGDPDYAYDPDKN
jgi:hypothetical protein